MPKTHFVISHEIAHPRHTLPGPALYLQWGHYRYEDNRVEWGYRFIWTSAKGNTQARGPARIPSLADIDLLTRLAEEQGWGEWQGAQPPGAAP